MIKGRLSVETLTTLTYILRALVDCAKYLLDEKRVKHVLIRKIYSNPIEMNFCMMRGILGMNAVLSSEPCYQNSYSYLLRDITYLSKNDGILSVEINANIFSAI